MTDAMRSLDVRASDLTIGEKEHLMEPLIAVGDEIHNRGKDPELGEMVHEMMCRLPDSDTSEIADDTRHELWCGAAQRFDLTADDRDDGDGTVPSSAAPVSGSRQ